MDFDQIYQKYQTYAERIISRHVPEDDVPDAMQEMWIIIHRHIESGTPVSNVKAWIANWARAAAKESNRYRRDDLSLDTPIATDADGETLTLADTLSDVSESSIDTAVTDAVRDAVDQLSPALRETLEAHYYAGESIADIAIRAGVPIGTVKARLARARDALRAMLTADGEDAAA